MPRPVSYEVRTQRAVLVDDIGRERAAMTLREDGTPILPVTTYEIGPASPLRSAPTGRRAGRANGKQVPYWTGPPAGSTFSENPAFRKARWLWAGVPPAAYWYRVGGSTATLVGYELRSRS